MTLQAASLGHRWIYIRKKLKNCSSRKWAIRIKQIFGMSWQYLQSSRRIMPNRSHRWELSAPLFALTSPLVWWCSYPGLLIYDALLCADSEIQAIWSRRVSGAHFFYLAIRVGTLLAFALALITIFGPHTVPVSEDIYDPLFSVDLSGRREWCCYSHPLQRVNHGIPGARLWDFCMTYSRLQLCSYILVSFLVLMLMMGIVIPKFL